MGNFDKQKEFTHNGRHPSDYFHKELDYESYICNVLKKIF